MSNVKTGRKNSLFTHFYMDVYVDDVYIPVSLKTRQEIGCVTPGFGWRYES